MLEDGLTEDLKERVRVINNEIRLVYDEFSIGNFGRAEDELEGLRYSAGDLEEVEKLVTQRVLDNTTVKDGSKEFEDVIKHIIFMYYLMLHFTSMYLESGDFPRLAQRTFEDIWRNMHVEDKATVIEMALLLEDNLAVVHGMYVLLAQVERN